MAKKKKKKKQRALSAAMMEHSLVGFRRKIRSVIKVQQITRAMMMVSAVRLRKAQELVEKSRPYCEAIAEMMRSAAKGLTLAENPFFEKREVKNVELIIVSADKGLCGAYNTNIIRRGLEEIRRLSGQYGLFVTTIGRKVNSYLIKHDIDVFRTDNELISDIDYAKVVGIINGSIQNYLEKRIDEVYVLYTKFFNTVRQQITLERLIPMIEIEDEYSYPEEGFVEHIFEPSKERLLSELSKRCIYQNFYLMLLNARASEIAARYMAMDNATDNSSDLIDALTLAMNKLRQEKITTEILEVTSGAEALKQ